MLRLKATKCVLLHLFKAAFLCLELSWARTLMKPGETKIKFTLKLRYQQSDL